MSVIPRSIQEKLERMEHFHSRPPYERKEMMWVYEMILRNA